MRTARILHEDSLVSSSPPNWSVERVTSSFRRRAANADCRDEFLITGIVQKGDAGDETRMKLLHGVGTGSDWKKSLEGIVSSEWLD